MNTVRSSLLFDSLAYLLGVAIGFLLILAGAWADMEASAYGFPSLANAGLGGLRCPVLMTPEETGTIWLSLTNSTDGLVSPSVKAQISTPVLPEEFTHHLRLTPGESTRLEWPVTSENIDMDRFILAKVTMFSAYPLPSQETTCGIFVVDLPATGRVLFPGMILLSLLLMGWGLLRMNSSQTASAWLRKHRGPLAFLALMIVVGLLIIVMGGWIASLFALVVILLLIVILVSSLMLYRPG